MFCPKCSLERKSKDTTYCTGCGFCLTEVAKLTDETAIEPATRPPEKFASHLTPRKRGLKQSYFIFLATFLIFAVGGLLQAFFRTDTRWFVITSLILIFVGAFRALYALAFESNEKVETFSVTQASIDTHLDQPKAIKESDYVSPAFDRSSATGDLAPLTTESTTKQLEKKLEP